MRGTTPEMRRLVQAALAAGWVVSRSGGDHLRFRSPGGALVWGPLTPGDRRTWLRVRAQLRRAGLSV